MLSDLDSEVLQAECLLMGEAALSVVDRPLSIIKIHQIPLSPSKFMVPLTPMLFIMLAPKTQKTKTNI